MLSPWSLDQTTRGVALFGNQCTVKVKMTAVIKDNKGKNGNSSQESRRDESCIRRWGTSTAKEDNQSSRAKRPYLSVSSTVSVRGCRLSVWYRGRPWVNGKRNALYHVVANLMSLHRTYVTGKVVYAKNSFHGKKKIIKCYWQSCLCQKQLPRYKNDNKMLLAKLSMPKQLPR